jgi:hypothetical protein
MRVSFLLIAILLLGCDSFATAQPRTLQVDLGSIRYEDGVVSMSVAMPKKKKKQKANDSASMIRVELISKIIDEGIEKTPYNRRFDVDKSVKLDALIQLLGADIQLYDVVVDKTMVYAECTFDIKHMERKLVDNGYLKRFGI